MSTDTLPVLEMPARVPTLTLPNVSVISRHDTQDEMAFREVFTDNCYRLPDHFEPDDIVIDVGAHIGSFAVACLVRGCKHYFGFEPDAANYELLLKNLAPWPWAKAANAAVWRSDRKDRLRFSGYANGQTACGSCLPGCTINGVNNQIPMASVGLDDAVRYAVDFNDIKDIRLVKVDAEGAEYPALYTSKELWRVEEIVGETHNIAKLDFVLDLPGDCAPNAGGMHQFLTSQGFDVELLGADSINTLFFARRR